jgi:hypothetical protein
MKINYRVTAHDATLHTLQVEYSTPDAPGKVLPMMFAIPVVDGQLLAGPVLNEAIAAQAPVFGLKRMAEVHGAGEPDPAALLAICGETDATAPR